MKFSLKYFFAITLLLFCPVIIFAEKVTPKEGDVIHMSVGGYDIQAKIMSVTDPSVKADALTQNITQPTETAPTQTTTQASSTKAESQPTNNAFILANMQQEIDNFAVSNPIKNGIDAIDNKISEQAQKWFHLVLQKPATTDTSSDASNSLLPASLMNGAKNYFADTKNYLYLGMAIVFLTILFVFWKLKKSRDEEY